MEFLRAVQRAVSRPRSIPFFESVWKRTALFSPSDWLVVWVLGFVMSFSAAALLAEASLAITTEVPTRGGTYMEGVVGSPRFVNPLLAVSDTDRDLATLIFSGLMKANPDGSITPDLADSYDISEDGLTYTFVLNNDARFHDGTPVTAEDVAFTVRSAQNPDVKSPRRVDWEGVAVTVENERTVVFTLAEPYSPFLENTTLGIVPKRLWEKVTAEEFAFSALNTHPIGSGPYKVENVKENSSGIPVEYGLHAFTDGVRAPFIERFIMRFYQNADELKNALNKKEVEAASSVNPNSVNHEVAVHEATFGRIFAVFLNQNQNKLFADTVIRKALDTALDRKQIIDTVLGSYGSPIRGPLPPRTDDATPEDATLPEARIEAARALLVENGWKVGEGGIFEHTKTVKGKKETVRLAFSLSTSNSPELKQAAESVAQMWRTLGADVSLKFFEQNDLNIEVIRPRKYDALLFGEVVGREPDLFAFWHSSQMNDPGLNIALYANSAVDKYLEEARTGTDLKKRRESAEEAAEEIEKERGAIFLYAPHFVYLAPKTVSGIAFGTIAVPSDRFDAIDRWYLSTERVWPVFQFEIKNLFK